MGLVTVKFSSQSNGWREEIKELALQYDGDEWPTPKYVAKCMCEEGSYDDGTVRYEVLNWTTSRNRR